MSSHFSDDRDVLPEPIHKRATTRKRYATASGKLTLLLLFLFVSLLSCTGGSIANIDEISEGRYSFRGNDFVLCRIMEVIFGLWIFAVGSSVGSFLNVVAWRGPRGMSINGHSFCPRCNVPISSIDNIPIVGWLRLRGRCLTCRLPISAKYPIFEAICGFMFLFLYVAEFLSHGINLPLVPSTRDAYGLPLNLTDLPPKLIWIFAMHLILLSTLLAIFMTRNSGHQMPSKYLIASLVVVTAILLIEPSASNAGLLSIKISPAQDLQELARFIAQAAIGAIVAAVFVAIPIHFAEYSKQPSTELVEIQANVSFISLLCNWFLVVLLLVVSIGFIPMLFILTVSTAVSAIYLMTDNDGLLKPWGYAQAWLVGVTYLFILSWKPLTNSVLHFLG